ncbi:ribonuclease D [Candidatus Endowatersipora endosymbiont of Watersipora subatra]|uniref:ribonuclease D n=1 Tax=Candidatus Endowatersipora endosymbiont of Watersipora subatra TaxID=3077946 RepID=UPI00312C91DD
MLIRLHKGDLENIFNYKDSVAIDTETLGLNIKRDRLCVVQLSPGDGSADIVQIEAGQSRAPNIEKLLLESKVKKIYHFGRFDISVLFSAFGILSVNNYCTKIASRLIRTYTDQHGLRDLTKEIIGVDLSKQQQLSNWAAETLSEAQKKYAATDVIYLHQLKEELDKRLKQEGRIELAQSCFQFLSQRCLLDLAGWEKEDIFSHSVR